jgi:hypothetical protein
MCRLPWLVVAVPRARKLRHAQRVMVPSTRCTVKHLPRPVPVLVLPSKRTGPGSDVVVVADKLMDQLSRVHAARCKKDTLNMANAASREKGGRGVWDMGMWYVVCAKYVELCAMWDVSTVGSYGNFGANSKLAATGS